MTPEQMASIHKAAFAPGRGWSVAEIEDLCRSERIACFSFRDGFALVRTLAEEAELLTLAVHPEGQRRGTAGAIMREWMAKSPAKTAFLEVAADNRAALSLYARHGFATHGYRKAYYSRPDQPPVDAVLMQAALTPRQSVK